MAANINDKFSEVSTGVRPTTTTVASVRATSGTSLVCDDLTGWATDTAVHFVTYQIDGQGKVVPGTQTDMKGIVSGNTIGSIVVTGGTDNGNSVGDIVQQLPTAGWADDLADGLLVSHNQDGTLKAGSVTPDALGDSGWINFVTTLPNVATNNLKYRRIGGVVYLHGQFALTSGNSFPAEYTEIGALPAGFRPISGGATRVPIATYQSGLSNLRIYSASIESGGTVSIYPEGSTAAGDVRFNVSYPADN